jgi:hypothetical protein
VAASKLGRAVNPQPGNTPHARHLVHEAPAHTTPCARSGFWATAASWGVGRCSWGVGCRRWHVMVVGHLWRRQLVGQRVGAACGKQGALVVHNGVLLCATLRALPDWMNQLRLESARFAVFWAHDCDVVCQCAVTLTA